VGKPCATLVGQTTDRLCAVGLAMLNDTPVMVDTLDAKSALDGDANFTGEKKRISKVLVVDLVPLRLLMNITATVTDQCYSSRRNPLHRAQLH
jgi:hypothetical protein